MCYLYTQSGKRLTDMYQEAGRAILGWEGGNARTVFKNALNRSVSGSFESEESHRLEKAVQALLPGYPVVRWYSSLPTCSTALSQWRPWQPKMGVSAGTGATEAEAVWFLPPFPLAANCVIVASKAGLQADFCSSTLFPPCLLAGITRSIYDLLQELPLRGEAGWGHYDAVIKAYWERRGPYLYPKVGRDFYGEFASRCLAAGVVISPDYDIPSLVPWGASGLPAL
jgi:hypothetical protein